VPASTVGATEDVTNAIETHGLVNAFGKTTALAVVDLAARTGSVLGLLGPNGAGKPDIGIGHFSLQ